MSNNNRENVGQSAIFALLFGFLLLLAAPLPALAQEAGTVTRDLPVGVDCEAGATFTVTLHVTPFEDTTSWFVEDRTPEGFEITAVSGPNGDYVEDQQRVKWVSFSGNAATLTYDVTVPFGTPEGTVLAFTGDHRFHPEMDERADIIGGTSVECTPPCPGGPDGTFHPYDAERSGVFSDDDLFALIDAWRVGDGDALDDLLFAGIDAWKRAPDSYC